MASKSAYETAGDVYYHGEKGNTGLRLGGEPSSLRPVAADAAASYPAVEEAAYISET